MTARSREAPPAPADAVRAWIVETLEGVEGFGRVHCHERAAARDAALRALYQPPGGGPLAGGFVRRVSRVDERAGGARVWRVAARWRVQAWRAFADAGGAAASERVLDAALDRAAAAFRGAFRDAERRGLLARADTGGGLRIDAAAPALFAGVLCHGARLSLTTTHYETEDGA